MKVRADGRKCNKPKNMTKSTKIRTLTEAKKKKSGKHFFGRTHLLPPMHDLSTWCQPTIHNIPIKK